MIASFIYHKTRGLKYDGDLEGAIAAAKDLENAVWIDVAAPTEEEIQRINAAYNLHELTVEDIMNPKVRPKVEEFETYLYVVFKALNFNEGADKLDTLNLNFLLMQNILITVHVDPIRSVTDTISEVRNHPSVMDDGPDFLMHIVVDRLVSEYIPMIEELNDTVDEIECEIYEDKSGPDVGSKLFRIKSEVAELRKRAGPQREMLAELSNKKHKYIDQEALAYFRNVYDHSFRVNYNLESIRDIVQGAIELHMSIISTRMNAVMKTLSIVATIVLPLNVLTGLYGTNFAHLPGSQYYNGFWIFVSILFLAISVGFKIFRIKKWM